MVRKYYHFSCFFLAISSDPAFGSWVDSALIGVSAALRAHVVLVREASNNYLKVSVTTYLVYTRSKNMLKIA